MARVRKVKSGKGEFRELLRFKNVSDQPRGIGGHRLGPMTSMNFSLSHGLALKATPKVQGFIKSGFVEVDIVKVHVEK